MARHYLIVNDLSNAPRDVAFVDVSTDAPPQTPITVQIEVLVPDPQTGQLPPPMQVALQNGFGRSATFRVVSNGLLRIDTPMPFAATLHQRSNNGKLVIASVDPARAAGRAFFAAVGDGGSAHILVGNPQDVPANVRLAIDSLQAQPFATATIPPLSAAKFAVPLLQRNVCIASDVDVLAQLAVDIIRVDVAPLLPL
ncbi:MAG: hypothetical protein HYV09_27320 [Deltaproteobacteria bacterium]|nr:hypothetical protein [Deltaproteobacteria bacterium]